MKRTNRPACWTSVALWIMGLSSLTIISCRSADPPPAEQDAPRLDSGWTEPNVPWRQASYGRVKVEIPSVEDAEIVGEDDMCAMCHKAYVDAFANNVHRQGKCESCHGPASRHVEERGKVPGLVLSFRSMSPAQRSEVCLKCHEKDRCAPTSPWRTSAHASGGVACTDCHRNHYNVPPGTSATSLDDDDVRYQGVRPDFQLAVHRQDEDEEEKLPSLRGTSNHLGAIAPGVCYRCHGEKQELETIAHPHQINGPNGINCTTCHNPHGNVIEWSRKELCLTCHDGSPTQAWHSSTHNHAGVACTDCHNPHPNPNVPQVVNISHTSVQRSKRLPMSVNEPQACYKCHPKIQGLTQLPSHHPIREGKMTCSDCHDPHDQADRNLRNETVNLVCYKCHADKQGPFVYQHAPVEENCAICHNPHGTVANNLLRQPPTFLCLRCHSGHRSPPATHFGQGVADIDGNPALRPALYTNCTQCHQQIHGSDLPSQQRTGAFLR